MSTKKETSPESQELHEALAATNIQEVEAILNRSMAGQRIQALIKAEGLDLVVAHILALANKDSTIELMAGAALARLAAVARGTREREVHVVLPALFTVRPPSIETLSTGDDKAYGAIAIGHSRAAWLSDYCIVEAVSIDTAEEARRELLARALDECGSLSRFLRELERRSELVREISNVESRLKRTRRIFAAVVDILGPWKGELGHEAGTALGDCLAAFLRGASESTESDVLTGVIDAALLILSRMIERRFSCAFDSTSYAVVERAQQSNRLGWHTFLGQSASIGGLQTHLLETALVLVRQNRTDTRIMEAIAVAFGSRSRAALELKKHLTGAQDADPTVRTWWEGGGVVEQSQRVIDQKFGNNEDHQIGSLLIEVESNKEAMEKVSRAVVPILEISDPVLASTVKNATAGYAEIAQTARRLARMRRLSKTDLRGERLEYNPLEHEMVGGHQAGVRLVRVVRDGIRKDFGGKIKTLVKPWVEPE